MPRVSVIIPTYNRATLVVAAIDSVLQQTYRDTEIIVVDDGSTDDTEARLAAYGSRIVYLKQANGGIDAARNRGLDAATGEYVALLDSDDLWLDFKLELQVALLDHFPEVGFVHSEFFIFKESGERTPAGLRSWYVDTQTWQPPHDRRIPAALIERLPPAGARGSDYQLFVGNLYHRSLTEPGVLPSTAVFRRRCLAPDIRFVDEEPSCGDWEFFARLSRRHGYLFMDVETTLNRSHEDAVRLTRMPKAFRLQRRLNMIRRVWKQDFAYYAEHRQQVDQLEHQLLIKLALLHLLESNTAAARTALRQAQTLPVTDHSLRTYLIKLAVQLPGASTALRSLRNLRHRLAV